jgi:Fur family transcriptional regulator, ferric uptake regulator
LFPLVKLHTYLVRHHYSRTRARDQVYMSLGELGPCTKGQLARALGGSMNQSTVYRTVNFFLEIGVATTVRYRLIELSGEFKQHHHHFVCNDCGREISFNDEGLERALRRIAEKRNLRLDEHQVELAGQCFKCGLEQKFRGQ